MTIAYDGYGRITRLTRNYEKMTVSYSPLEIKIEERDDYDDEQPYVMSWKEISLNSAGYISQATIIDGEDVYIRQFYYDAAGHLVKSVDDEGFTTTFSWDSLGHLTKVTDDEVTVVYHYYPIMNKHSQWNPSGVVYADLVECTGLLGVPPSYLVKSFTQTEFSYGYEETSTISYSYNLDHDGWIIQSKITGDDGATPILTWYYSKK